MGGAVSFCRDSSATPDRNPNDAASAGGGTTHAHSFNNNQNQNQGNNDGGLATGRSFSSRTAGQMAGSSRYSESVGRNDFDDDTSDAQSEAATLKAIEEEERIEAMVARITSAVDRWESSHFGLPEGRRLAALCKTASRDREAFARLCGSAVLPISTKTNTNATLPLALLPSQSNAHNAQDVHADDAVKPRNELQTSHAPNDDDNDDDERDINYGADQDHADDDECDGEAQRCPALYDPSSVLTRIAELFPAYADHLETQCVNRYGAEAAFSSLKMSARFQRPILGLMDVLSKPFSDQSCLVDQQNQMMPSCAPPGIGFDSEDIKPSAFTMRSNADSSVSGGSGQRTVGGESESIATARSNQANANARKQTSEARGGESKTLTVPMWAGFPPHCLTEALLEYLLNAVDPEDDEAAEVQADVKSIAESLYLSYEHAQDLVGDINATLDDQHIVEKMNQEQHDMSLTTMTEEHSDGLISHHESTQLPSPLSAAVSKAVPVLHDLAAPQLDEAWVTRHLKPFAQVKAALRELLCHQISDDARDAATATSGAAGGGGDPHQGAAGSSSQALPTYIRIGLFLKLLTPAVRGLQTPLPSRGAACPLTASTQVDDTKKLTSTVVNNGASAGVDDDGDNGNSESDAMMAAVIPSPSNMSPTRSPARGPLQPAHSASDGKDPTTTVPGCPTSNSNSNSNSDSTTPSQTNVTAATTTCQRPKPFSLVGPNEPPTQAPPTNGMHASPESHQQMAAERAPKLALVKSDDFPMLMATVTSLCSTTDTRAFDAYGHEWAALVGALLSRASPAQKTDIVRSVLDKWDRQRPALCATVLRATGMLLDSLLEDVEALELSPSPPFDDSSKDVDSNGIHERESAPAESDEQPPQPFSDDKTAEHYSENTSGNAAAGAENAPGNEGDIRNNGGGSESRPAASGSRTFQATESAADVGLASLRSFRVNAEAVCRAVGSGCGSDMSSVAIAALGLLPGETSPLIQLLKFADDASLAVSDSSIPQSSKPSGIQASSELCAVDSERTTEGHGTNGTKRPQHGAGSEFLPTCLLFLAFGLTRGGRVHWDDDVIAATALSFSAMTDAFGASWDRASTEALAPAVDGAGGPRRPSHRAGPGVGGSDGAPLSARTAAANQQRKLSLLKQHTSAPAASAPASAALEPPAESEKGENGDGTGKSETKSTDTTVVAKKLLATYITNLTAKATQIKEKQQQLAEERQKRRPESIRKLLAMNRHNRQLRRRSQKPHAKEPNHQNQQDELLHQSDGQRTPIQRRDDSDSRRGSTSVTPRQVTDRRESSIASNGDDSPRCYADGSPKKIGHLSFIFGRVLGSGTFGAVKYARFIEPGILQSMWLAVAVKQVDKSVVLSSDAGKAVLGKEIAAMVALSAPNPNPIPIRARSVSVPDISSTASSFRSPANRTGGGTVGLSSTSVSGGGLSVTGSDGRVRPTKPHVRISDLAKEALEQYRCDSAGLPGVVHLFGTYHDKLNLNLVQEYCGRGDLHTLALSSTAGKKFAGRSEWVRFVLFEVAVSLAQIHSRGFSYGDVKPENVVFSDDGHAKLCDFGTCQRIRTADNQTFVGVPSASATAKLPEPMWECSQEDGRSPPPDGLLQGGGGANDDDDGDGGKIDDVNDTSSDDDFTNANAMHDGDNDDVFGGTAQYAAPELARVMLGVTEYQESERPSLSPAHLPPIAGSISSSSTPRCTPQSRDAPRDFTAAQNGAGTGGGALPAIPNVNGLGATSFRQDAGLLGRTASHNRSFGAGGYSQSDVSSEDGGRNSSRRSVSMAKKTIDRVALDWWAFAILAAQLVRGERKMFRESMEVGSASAHQRSPDLSTAATPAGVPQSDRTLPEADVFGHGMTLSVGPSAVAGIKTLPQAECQRRLLDGLSKVTPLNSKPPPPLPPSSDASASTRGGAATATNSQHQPQHPPSSGGDAMKRRSVLSAMSDSVGVSASIGGGKASRRATVVEREEEQLSRFFAEGDDMDDFALLSLLSTATRDDDIRRIIPGFGLLPRFVQALLTTDAQKRKDGFLFVLADVEFFTAQQVTRAPTPQPPPASSSNETEKSSPLPATTSVETASNKPSETAPSSSTVDGGTSAQPSHSSATASPTPKATTSDSAPTDPKEDEAAQQSLLSYAHPSGSLVAFGAASTIPRGPPAAAAQAGGRQSGRKQSMMWRRHVANSADSDLNAGPLGTSSSRSKSSRKKVGAGDAAVWPAEPCGVRPLFDEDGSSEESSENSETSPRGHSSFEVDGRTSNRGADGQQRGQESSLYDPANGRPSLQTLRRASPSSSPAGPAPISKRTMGRSRAVIGGGRRGRSPARGSGINAAQHSVTASGASPFNGHITLPPQLSVGGGVGGGGQKSPLDRGAVSGSFQARASPESTALAGPWAAMGGSAAVGAGLMTSPSGTPLATSTQHASSTTASFAGSNGTVPVPLPPQRPAAIIHRQRVPQNATGGARGVHLSTAGPQTLSSGGVGVSSPLVDYMTVAPGRGGFSGMSASPRGGGGGGGGGGFTVSSASRGGRSSLSQTRAASDLAEYATTMPVRGRM